MKEQRPMFLQNLKNKPSAVMRLGLLFLVLATSSNVFMRRSGRVPEDMVDLITGLLYGLAIPTLLWSVVLRRTGPPRS
jgi:hypothetical protein